MDWQPIETAPKDGTDILVYRDACGVDIVHVAWYRSREEFEAGGEIIAGCESLEEWEGWWSHTTDTVCQDKLAGYKTPTHWMPFKAPQETDR